MSRTTYRSDSKIRTVAAVAVFCALAYVACVVFHFRASFLTFDLKDAVMTVGAMLFGPAWGFAMVLVVALIEMVTVSTTGLYGFVMNVLASASFVCAASFIYTRRRTMKGALVGTLCAVAAMTAVMMLANLVITPFYMGATAADVAKLIPTLLLPFNLTKAVFNAALVFILYKPISAALRRAGFASVTVLGTDTAAHKPEKTRGLGLTIVIAALVAAAALVFFFLVLHGSVSFG
jgi:riboflavin transporter FmnP